MENPDAAIPRSIFFADLTGLVLAAVIDEKALEIGESLRQDAINTMANGCFCVISWYYYRNCRIAHNAISRSKCGFLICHNTIKNLLPLIDNHIDRKLLRL